MDVFPRITRDPAVMAGRATVRGLRVTVGMIVNRIAAGGTAQDLLADCPHLEAEDISQALAYAAWRLDGEEFDLILV